MIYPMMVNVDFASLSHIGDRPKGMIITLVVNWLIKPFTMAGLGVLFFELVFREWVDPQDAKEYLHRSGRTARAGEEGLVVTFVEYNQETEVRVIQKEAGLLVEIEKMFSSDDRLDDLMSWEPAVIEDKPKPKRARRRSRNRI